MDKQQNPGSVRAAKSRSDREQQGLKRAEFWYASASDKKEVQEFAARLLRRWKRKQAKEVE